MENELFQKILPSDFAAWVKNVEDEQLQNLPRFVDNNYKVRLTHQCLSKLKLNTFFRLRIGASLQSCLSTPTRLRRGPKWL